MSDDTKALEIAAQCWCDPETSSIEMDVRLAAIHHPDRGGSAEIMATLNAARDEALSAIVGAP